MIKLPHTPDPSQARALRYLNALQQALASPTIDDASSATTQGVYLFGPVGRGKSMLMDNFYQQLAIEQKIRLHFHHFMRKVHAELHHLSGQDNPLERLAQAWARQYKVICLDEFMVEDIGDAMLLGTLWRHLFEHKVVLVTTSNIAPNALYRNGLQRDRFLPAIDLIKTNCAVLELNGEVDYRRQHEPQSLPYFSRQQQPLLDWLSAQTGPLQRTTQLTVQGRQLTCRGRNPRSAVFDFNMLCDGPRSQRDYMQLAEEHQVLAVTHVPSFSFVALAHSVQGIEDEYQRETSKADLQSAFDNQARRFMALVDECYDTRCLLLIHTVDTPHAPEATRPEMLYQGRALKIPFERCVSRLYEMQSWQL